MNRFTIHLIPHAHLDPVWLWDWREGLNEGIATCRAMLELMDENPEYTFSRGEASIYQHVADQDPEIFARIRTRIAEGRWEVVGGNWVQPDNNLPLTETLVRQHLIGQKYFRETLGVCPSVGWAPDSFGHSAGLPDILAGCGIRDFAFTRPEVHDMSLEQPAFWWQGSGGARVLAYRPLNGWYASERVGIVSRLAEVMAKAPDQKLTNVGFFFGLGNHGGGASRRHLAELEEWRRQHPEVTLTYSGMHRLFSAIRGEIASDPAMLPTVRGELGPILRGCYSSVARIKWPFRRLENLAPAAETLEALAAKPTAKPSVNLEQTWEGLAFNSFHDILPGSSIERVCDDQVAWLGGLLHRCQRSVLQSLNTLARRIDTTVPAVAWDHPNAAPLLLWNPHPYPYEGHVEMEAALDYRPVWAYEGKDDELPVEILGPDGEPLPFQKIAAEHNSAVGLPWRRRALVPVSLPPLGWQVVTMGWLEGARKPAGTGPAAEGGKSRISNGIFTVRADEGSDAILIEHCGGAFSAKRVFLEVAEDRFGSWGDQRRSPPPEPAPAVRERWTIAQVELRESGPERAALWIRLAGKNSRVDVTCSVSRNRPAVDMACRIFWDDRSARLRFAIPGITSAVFDVPGGQAVRAGIAGEVSGLGCARVRDGQGGFGFISDALSSFSVADDVFCATLARASRYADERDFTATQEPWVPAVDAGELRCQVAFTAQEEDFHPIAARLNIPPMVQTVIASPAQGQPLSRRGSFASLLPTHAWKLLALKQAEDGDGLVIRLQNLTAEECRPELSIFDTKILLDQVPPLAIVSWRLREENSRWTAQACDSLESTI